MALYCAPEALLGLPGASATLGGNGGGTAARFIPGGRGGGGGGEGGGPGGAAAGRGGAGARGGGGGGGGGGAGGGSLLCCMLESSAGCWEGSGAGKEGAPPRGAEPMQLTSSPGCGSGPPDEGGASCAREPESAASLAQPCASGALCCTRGPWRPHPWCHLDAPPRACSRCCRSLRSCSHRLRMSSSSSPWLPTLHPREGLQDIPWAKWISLGPNGERTERLKGIKAKRGKDKWQKAK